MPPPLLVLLAASALLILAALLLGGVLLHARSVVRARRARARARDADVLSGMRVGAATPPPKLVRALTEAQLACAAPVAQAAPAGAACAVCLEEMGAGDALRRICVCGHVFHSACLRAWVRKDGSCPCCRERLVRGGQVDGIAVIRRAQLAVREGRGRLGEPRGRSLPPTGGVILTAKTWDAASSGGGSVCDEHDQVAGATF